MKHMEVKSDMHISKIIETGCVIVGGGPSGTGPLIYAGWAGRLDDFLADGVVLVEESSELCTGAITAYDIPANSPADRFLEALEHPDSQAAFPRACASASRAELDAVRKQYIPLPRVGRLLREIGLDLRSWFERNDNAHLLDGCRVDCIRQLPDGRHEIAVVRSGEPRQLATLIRAKKILIATGGVPFIDREFGAAIARACDQAKSQPTFVTSEQLLSRAVSTGDILSPCHHRVVIVGGSHSAFSAAGLLLTDFPEERFGEGSILIAHRSRIKLYYDSAAHAQVDGYDEFGQDDVCPQTKRIYRVGGLRGAARELYRRVTSSPGAVPEARIRLLATPGAGDPATWLIDWATVGAVVFASGYRLREIPIFDQAGAEVPLLGSFTGRYVDTKSRLLRADGQPIANVFAVGAASGYLPQEEFGGERSFVGRESSIWLCQHGLGQHLVEALVAREAECMDRTTQLLESDIGA